MALLLATKLTPEPLTHDNLAKSGITNLPSLAHNPLLATYLCDASTDATTCTAGRRRLYQTLRAQGFSPDDFTHYPPVHNDTAFDIACALRDDLA